MSREIIIVAPGDTFAVALNDLDLEAQIEISLAIINMRRRQEQARAMAEELSDVVRS